MSKPSSSASPPSPASPPSRPSPASVPSPASAPLPASPPSLPSPAAGPRHTEERLQAVVHNLMAIADLHKPAMPGWLGQELTVGQMRLLLRLGSEGPAPMSRIAEWLGSGLPAASGVVERLERHGLVARVHRSDDRRIVECGLTDQGRELVADLTGHQIDSIRGLLELLTPDELDQLDRILIAVGRRVISRPA